MDRLDQIDFLCGCVELRLGCLIISYIHVTLCILLCTLPDKPSWRIALRNMSKILPDFVRSFRENRGHTNHNVIYKMTLWLALSVIGLISGGIMLNRGANVFMGTAEDIEITNRFGDDFMGRANQGSTQTSIASLIMFVCVISIVFAIALIVGILKKNAQVIKLHIIGNLVLITILTILCSVWCFYDRFIYIAGFVVLVLFEFYSILVTQKLMREISHEKGRIYRPQPSAPPEPQNQFLPRV